MFIKKSMITIALSLFVLSGCQQSSGTTSGTANSTDSPQAESTAAAQPTTPASTATATPTPDTRTGSGTASELPSKAPMSPVTAARLADAKQGWIGGKGWIAHTSDGGAKWQIQYEGAGDVKQLFALNGQDAWAVVGDDAKLLGTTDGGKHWAAVGKVPNAGFLHFVTKQEGFSGNAMTVDGGKSWTSLPVPDGITGKVAYFHDKANGWGVKQVGDTIQVERTKDGGKTWHAVMARKTVAPPTDAVIRSAGANDAWIELIGDSGMTQTSYSLFHTSNGGKDWQTVLANSTAGGGPAPGVPDGDTQAHKNNGSKPGPLYVVSPEVAFMGGQCPACDKPNTLGWTKDGGKTWVNGKESFTGFGDMLLAMADANQGWLITNDNSQPSVMYTTATGGDGWKKVHTFDAPK
ncbi:YCF48-related protein [Paenibacillus sp. GCM10027628]|uniref:YCF48-related protein n=1 Tax=Paenibacillus sp. GCM10027628 TaxID=3273413 RepID=UPI0036425008